MTGPAAPLFEPDMLRLLQTLSLRARRVPTHGTEGRWRSNHAGTSVEFADYRTYTPGDDFRRVDWNAYARLERLFVRLYSAEEDLTLRLFLDTSASMAWASGRKARLAAQIAGALAFGALHNGDQVSLQTCRAGDGMAQIGGLERLRDHAAIQPAWRWLSSLQTAGATDLDAGLAAAARHLVGPGLAVVISDLLSPHGFQRGLDALLDRGQDLILIQVLAPDELEPSADMLGDWRLVDSEPEAPLQATITPSVLNAYKRLMARYIEEAQDVCRRRGATYVLVTSDLDLTHVLTRTLRTAGVLA
ncbi:MAG: DUF58 domain-containing protein [Chloroflexota bacterium]